MKPFLFSSILLLTLVSCGTNKHVNPWERQSSALDPVGITSKRAEARQKAEQATFKPGESVTFKKEKLVVFTQDPETNFSTRGNVKNGVGSAKVLVCGDLFAKVEFEDGGQGFVSVSEIVNPQESMSFFSVGSESGAAMFGPDSGLLPMSANMGAVSPEAAAASHSLDLLKSNTSLAPVPSGIQPQVVPVAPVQSVPLPAPSGKE